MKAVIYARYSSDNQREESIEGQSRECTAFAEKNGITILRHYIDRAFSAKTDNRPEFQNMVKDSGKRLFDMIIVWKLDRFCPQPLRQRALQGRSEKERGQGGIRHRGHFRWGRGNYSGKRAGGLLRILLRRPVRKGSPGHDGERPEIQVQRRHPAHRLSDRQRPVLPA